MKYLFVLFICGLLLSGCKISNQLKYYQKYEGSGEKFDAIIVPGVPFENGNWSRVMKLRMYWTKYLWDHQVTHNVIFSGGAVYTKYSECKIMKLYALEMGIPEEHIYLDSLAEHSTENVFFSTRIAKEKGFKKIAFASDPYQTRSLKPFFRTMKRKTGYKVWMLPAIMDTIETMETPDFEIDYQNAIGSNFVDIVNTQKKLYRIRGTLGQHIDWKTF